MTDLERKIVIAESQVITKQLRVIEQKEKANAIVKQLESQAKELEEVKKEWIRKRNLEEERVKLEMCELKKAHRHAIEDLRYKYEIEREDRLRDLKFAIQDEERIIEDWHKKKSEAIAKTMVEKSEIDARNQAKVNALLRDEQAASRKGVVRQKRLLTAPNVYSMELDRDRPIGMKKRPYTAKRFV